MAAPAGAIEERAANKEATLPTSAHPAPSAHPPSGRHGWGPPPAATNAAYPRATSNAPRLHRGGSGTARPPAPMETGRRMGAPTGLTLRWSRSGRAPARRQHGGEEPAQPMQSCSAPGSHAGHSSSPSADSSKAVARSASSSCSAFASSSPHLRQLRGPQARASHRPAACHSMVARRRRGRCKKQA